jgi:hypothetical protein
VKTNKKKYFASRQPISYKRHKSVEKESIILLHKIGIKDMSRAMVDEQISKYMKNLTHKFNNLNILNYVVLNSETRETDIKLLYPDFYSLKSELFEHLPNSKKRKMKIFELLNEIK